MPDVILTFTAAQLTRIIDASADIYGYQATLPDGASNPQTKAQFAKAMLVQHLKNLVRDSETRVAIKPAVAAVTDLGSVTTN